MDEKDAKASQAVLSYERAVSPHTLNQYRLGYVLSTSLVFSAFASLIHGLHGEASFYPLFPIVLIISTRTIYRIWRTAREAETVISAHVKVMVLLWIAGVLVGGLATWSMMTSVDGHVLGRNRNMCAGHLRELNLALMIYANDHDRKMPASLSELLSYRSADWTITSFSCPGVLGGYPVKPVEETLLAQIVSGNTDYVYRGAGLELDSHDESVLMHDRLLNHSGDGEREGINVLFLNGRIEWLPLNEAKKVIAELDAGHNPPRAGMGG